MSKLIEEIKTMAIRLRDVGDEYIKKHEKMERSSSGFCIAFSLALKLVLEKNGISSRVVRGRFMDRGHAWIEVQGAIVDISQDQFGNFPSVWVGDSSDRRYIEVTEDKEFDKEMGVNGDDTPWTFMDTDGEESPLGTCNSVARDLFAAYEARAANRF